MTDTTALNARVAKAKGWLRVTQVAYGGVREQRWRDPDGNIKLHIPNYAGSADVALLELNPDNAIRCNNMSNGRERPWTASADTIRWFSGETLAIAITEAWLAVNEK